MLKKLSIKKQSSNIKKNNDLLFQIYSIIMPKLIIEAYVWSIIKEL
jgi:hypothetical protein